MQTLRSTIPASYPMRRYNVLRVLSVRPNSVKSSLNDFSAELVGTYYASIINEIEQLGQINQEVHWQPDLDVQVAFDIGLRG